MRVFSKYILIVFLILLAATLLVVLFSSSQNQKPIIPLSELAQKINSGNVKQINVRGDDL